MQKIIVFNWKNKPNTEQEAVELLNILKKFLEGEKSRQGIKDKRRENLKEKFILCLPFIYLSLIKNILKQGYSLGAQDLFWWNKVSATGEITPKMLFSFGVKYVIIGHSERRRYFYEDSAMINSKIKAALLNKLIPIVCIGEENRDQGEKFNTQLKRLLLNQLNSAFKGINLTTSQKIILAYEPGWAIGQKQGESPEEVKEVLSFLRLWLRKRFSEQRAKLTPLLYGGAVKSYNMLDYLYLKESDGLLIGSASTQKQQLNKILKLLMNE